MPQVIDPRDELISALARYLGGRYSDLTIVGASRQWAVHKAIVCPRSGFFDAACEGSFKEASTNRIVLRDDDEDALDHMIHSIQISQRERAIETINSGRRQHKRSRSLSIVEHQLVSLPAKNIPEHKAIREEDVTIPPTNLVLHARVYALADKFDVFGLKTLVKMKFATAMTNCHACAELAEAIDEVYNSTADSDRGLRDIVIQAMRFQPHLTANEAIMAVIKRTAPLAFELWRVERGHPV
ncbi:hypothetical protein AMS68_007918 [Peltaster fructicola]|uniref:BTB domain-containing protein n=1 Tax=Peltaster fructicola TaxID=286661 RepID=A0A6H0Y6D1_9PEZI|nr:hypothetical protein AMS68_007918 [Peltaster fructicola]